MTLDPNEGRIPAKVSREFYEHTLNMVFEAGHLLDDALAWLQKADHVYDCPRNMDDYDCTCGLSDIKARIKEWLEK